MTSPCPVCGAPDSDRRDNPHRPFCGRRCQQEDLLRWLDGDYCVSEPLIPGMPELGAGSDDDDRDVH